MRDWVEELFAYVDRQLYAVGLIQRWVVGRVVCSPTLGYVRAFMSFLFFSSLTFP